MHTILMSSPAQTIMLLSSVIFAYIWLSFPEFSSYSLQLVGFIVLLYLVIKKASAAKFWHLAPNITGNFELAMISLGLLLLIGSTGNEQSYFFPLIYLNLYFLVMITDTFAALIVSSSFLILFLALSLHPEVNLPNLLSIPVVVILMLLAKKQYQEFSTENNQLPSDSALIKFIKTVIIPKLQLLSHLADFPEANQETIRKQVELLETETKDVLGKTNNASLQEEKTAWNIQLRLIFKKTQVPNHRLQTMPNILILTLFMFWLKNLCNLKKIF